MRTGGAAGTSATWPESSRSTASSTLDLPRGRARSARLRPRSRREEAEFARSSARSARTWTRTEWWGGNGDLRRVPGRLDRAARRRSRRSASAPCACAARLLPRLVGRPGAAGRGRARHSRCWSWCWSWSASSASTSPAGCCGRRSPPGSASALAAASPARRGSRCPRRRSRRSRWRSRSRAALLVTAHWAMPTQTGLDIGMYLPNTTWHNAPFAARFVQDAQVGALHLTEVLQPDRLVLPPELRAAALGGPPLHRQRLPLAADEHRLDGALPARGLELRAALRAPAPPPLLGVAPDPRRRDAAALPARRRQERHGRPLLPAGRRGDPGQRRGPGARRDPGGPADRRRRARGRRRRRRAAAPRLRRHGRRPDPDLPARRPDRRRRSRPGSRSAPSSTCWRRSACSPSA